MFITFEGIEGAGKGTLIQLLCTHLDATNIPYVHTREPGGCTLGVTLRAQLLDVRHNIVPQAELFLYLADRAQHVQEIIRPALDKKMLVISDRYADSTIVYQGYGRGLDVAQLISLNEMATSSLWPDTTFLLDVPPEIGLHRAKTRNEKTGIAETEGRFEAEKMEFHERIRQGYLTFAQKNAHRYVTLNATQPPSILLNDCLEVLHTKYSQHFTKKHNHRTTK